MTQRERIINLVRSQRQAWVDNAGIARRLVDAMALPATERDEVLGILDDFSSPEEIADEIIDLYGDDDFGEDDLFWDDEEDDDYEDDDA